MLCCFLFSKAVVSTAPHIMATAVIAPMEYWSILKVLLAACEGVGDGVGIVGCCVGVDDGFGVDTGLGVLTG